MGLLAVALELLTMSFFFLWHILWRDGFYRHAMRDIQDDYP